MIPILRKEIAGFFNSLTGYIVIIVFLLVHSLFMWIFPGQWNILDAGYANLDTFFVISPWVFLFLVPAVTMRMISEEKQSGTIEILLTQPVTYRQVLAGKFLAAVCLVLLALVPCLVYYFSVWQLGETPGNLDHGAFWGSFIGLFFLAAAYSAAGLFASSLSNNQIVAFILGVLFCFLLFYGFDSFALIPGLRPLDDLIVRLGINEHYESLSRGVIDNRDILYFLLLIFLFLEVSRLVMESRTWNRRKEEGHALAGERKERPGTRIRSSFARFGRNTGIALLAAFLLSGIHFRIDLTADKRYSLSDQTRSLLEELEREVYIEVFMEGEMPVAFRKLRQSLEDMLEEFRAWSGNKIAYSFINPGGSEKPEVRNARYRQLVDKGLQPINIQDRDGDGGMVQRIVFPGMIMNMNGVEMPVNFLKNNPKLSPEENLNRSLEGLEYEIVQPLKTLLADTVYHIAFLEGHNELQEIEVADIIMDLARFFTIDRGSVGGSMGMLDRYAAVVVAKPRSAFTEEDKLVLDQYIMHGGKVLWLVEEVDPREDSLRMGETIAVYKPLNIEDQLFRYGVRINPVLVQDFDCITIPMKTSVSGGQEQTIPVPWLYYPLLQVNNNHPITRSINKVQGEYVNTIDTVGQDTSIRKTVLLATSEYSRLVSPPVQIRLSDFRDPPPEKEFSQKHLPVAVLLEGRFTSVFSNRMTRHLTEDPSFNPRNKSEPTRMIVVADGDIIRNGVRRQGGQLVPTDLGADPYTLQVHGNTDFLVNALNYLVDESGITALRAREFKLRLLDKMQIRQQKVLWQFINTILPVVLVIAGGILWMVLRRRKFAYN